MQLQDDTSDSGMVTMTVDRRRTENNIWGEGDEVLAKGCIHFLAMMAQLSIWKTQKGNVLDAEDLRRRSRFLGALSGKVCCFLLVLLIKGAAVGNNDKGGCCSTLRISGDCTATAETLIVGMWGESEDAIGGGKDYLHGECFLLSADAEDREFNNFPTL